MVQICFGHVRSRAFNMRNRNVQLDDMHSAFHTVRIRGCETLRSITFRQPRLRRHVPGDCQPALPFQDELTRITFSRLSMKTSFEGKLTVNPSRPSTPESQQRG